MKYREGYEQGKFDGEWVGNQLKDADKIRRELNKPVIPQFVADWIEVAKPVYSLSGGMTYGGPGVNKWLAIDDNQEIFALAWFLGYEVEKEKRYLVRIKGVEEDNAFLNYYVPRNEWFLDSACDMGDIHAFHTRKKLEEAGFGWVFDCEGVKIEEVEDE